MKTTLAALAAAALILALAPSSQACFDAYLFLQGKGMVYPYGMWAFDGAGEYVIGGLKEGGEPDMFTGDLNVYYGLARGFSVQAVVSSSEKERTQFKLDEVGLRGVCSILSNYGGVYNLDLILEHHLTAENHNGVYELSAPSIWRNRGLTYVFHPVLAFGRDVQNGVRGHGGVFYTTRNNSIIGVGAEFESAQSSSNLGRRLVQGEAGSSLFFGSMIGPSVFLQNELIKGWGAGASKGDIGFAFTLKFIIEAR